MGGTGVRPFRVAVGDDVLDDLAARLDRVRWPDEIPGSAGTWEYGTDLGYLRELVAYWRDGFDWRAQEKAINEFPQFMAEVGDVDVHFLHVEGNGPDAAAPAAVPRLAGVVLGVLPDHPPADRPGPLRRRPVRRLHGGGAVAARLRLLVPARPAPLQPRGRWARSSAS